MTSKTKLSRKPQAFPISTKPVDEPAGRQGGAKVHDRGGRPARAQRSLTNEHELQPLADPAPIGALDTVKDKAPRRCDMRWGRLLWSSLAALASLAIGLAAADLIEALFARSSWLGWFGSVALALGLVAALAIMVREALALARLKSITRIRGDAEIARSTRAPDVAASVNTGIKRLYRGRNDRSWALSRYLEHEAEIVDALDLMALAERELVMPLDRDAQRIVADTAKRVSLMTALAPGAVLDIVVVAAANIAMLRRLAACYGGRPGLIGLARLARMVATHLALTGGIAVGDNVLHQILGHGLAAKLSAKLGEGMLNGVLSARIGLAAIDLCRPLPFHEAPRPGLNDVLGTLISFAGKAPAKSPNRDGDKAGKAADKAARNGDTA